MDVGTQIAHGAVRSYVMGDRGARNEPATPEDIEAMKQLVKGAIVAGALGFSTSRTLAHLAIDGEPVPGTYATEDELFGIGEALGELGTGIFELAPAGVAGEDIINPKKEVDWMRRLSATIHRPITFALVQVDDAPDLWRELMDESLRAVSDGADLWPQVAGRGFGLLSGHFTTYSLFDQIPAYQELKARGLAPEALVDALRDERGSSLDRGVGAGPGHRRAHGPGLPHHLHAGEPPRLRTGPGAVVGRNRRRTGRDPLSVAYDAMLEDEGRGLLYVPDPQLLERRPRAGTGDAPPSPRRRRPR